MENEDWSISWHSWLSGLQASFIRSWVSFAMSLWRWVLASWPAGLMVTGVVGIFGLETI